MHDITWETYHKEFTLMDSLKYTNRRLMNEVELSSLISSLHELLFEVLKPQLTSEKMHIFSEIDEYCIDIIRHHHKKTAYLNSKEFLVWHLSMFMVIQTFVEIVESKYKLEQKEKIEHTFDELVKTDFYRFIALNCKTMKIDDITDKLLTGKSRVMRESSEKIKLERTGEYWGYWHTPLDNRIIVENPPEHPKQRP